MFQNQPPTRPSRLVRSLNSVFSFVLRAFLWLLPHPRGSVYVPNKRDTKFEQEVRRELSFLFDQYKATVISNVKYRSFGSAEIILEAANIALQVFKDGREHELRVMTAPRSGDWTWERFDVVLAASVGTEDPRKLRYRGSCDRDPSEALAELAKLLQPRFQQLNEALSQNNYLSTQARLMEARRYLIT
jgi:hypothetical protein